jgi:nucleoside 2-deoxyribosyltransferase
MSNTAPARIYLAARYDQHPRMRAYAERLEAAGHVVTSRWIDQHDGEAGDGCSVDDINDRPEYAAKFAAKDLADILKSDTMIVFTDWPSSTGGRHVETGVAFALRIAVHIVGRRENIFQALGSEFTTHHRDLRAFEDAWGLDMEGAR